MIKSVTITNDRNESIKMILSNPDLSEFVVASIEGLEPEKADIASTELVTGDGSTFNNARKQTKQITFNLIFYPNDYNVERVRHKCYNFFPVKKKIEMLFETDERYAWIEGYVESNTPSIFSEQEGAQVSVICMNPYFRSSVENETALYGIQNQFAFPFSNESLTDSLVVIGSIRHNQTSAIYNMGDEEVGMELIIKFKSNCSGLVFGNTVTEEEMILNNLGLVEGDTLHVLTYSGEKDIYSVDSNGNRTSMVTKINKSTKFPMLLRGYNNVYVNINNINDCVETMYINNRIIYGGI